MTHTHCSVIHFSQVLFGYINAIMLAKLGV